MRWTGPKTKLRKYWPGEKNVHKEEGRCCLTWQVESDGHKAHVQKGPKANDEITYVLLMSESGASHAPVFF